MRSRRPLATAFLLLRRLLLVPFPRARRPSGAEAGNAPARAARGRAARRTGRRGERIAARALRARGWRVLARNVRTRAGEIDLVAEDGDTVVLVEVKARRDRGDRPLSDRVDHRKRARLRGAWAALARGSGLAGRPWRFDVVEVDASVRPPAVAVRSGAFRAGR